MFISHHEYNNIKIIVDRNHLSILGNTEELLKLKPLDKKFESFGFTTRTINGHDFDQLRSSFYTMEPQVIIADTIKGNGVSYMEGKWEYHTIIPSERKLIETGLKELS
jgi:transketolase